MLVRPPRLWTGPTEARCLAIVESESAAFSPFELSLSVPRENAGWLDVSGNAYVPGLLALAGHLGERLHIEAPVSATLIQQAAERSGANGGRGSAIRVNVTASSERVATGHPQAVGMAFDCGLDAVYAALRLTGTPSAGAQVFQSVMYLVYAPELEGAASIGARVKALHKARKLASALGLALAPVGCNIRELVDRFVPWERVCREIHAAVALALGRQFRVMIVPAGIGGTPDDSGDGPGDRLWSTECTQLVAEAVGVSRDEKMQFLACQPDLVACVNLQLTCPANGGASRSDVDSGLIVEAAPGLAAHLAPPEITTRLPSPIVPRESVHGNAQTRFIEVSWAGALPGRIAMPLRPMAAQRQRIIRACRTNARRPVTWCLIDSPSPQSAELLQRLSDSWGEGIAFLGRAPVPGGDHGVPRDEAAAIQRHCRIRAWPGCQHWLDPFRVLESLAHGCLPLQFVAEPGHEELATCLPSGLASFLLPWPAEGPLPVVDSAEIGERLERGLSVVLASTFEADWAVVLEHLASAA